MLKKIGNILSTVIIVLLVLVLLFNLICYVKREKYGEQCPTVLGFGVAVVISGSMEPNIMVGDLVIIHEQDDYELKDVVCYTGNNYPVTHRIISMRTDEEGAVWYTTKGDFNNKDDGEIAADRMIGKVIAVIPDFGEFQKFIQTGGGFLLLVAMLLVVLAIHELSNLFYSLKRKKRR